MNQEVGIASISIKNTIFFCPRNGFLFFCDLYILILIFSSKLWRYVTFIKMGRLRHVFNIVPIISHLYFSQETINGTTTDPVEQNYITYYYYSCFKKRLWSAWLEHIILFYLCRSSLDLVQVSFMFVIIHYHHYFASMSFWVSIQYKWDL